MERVVVGLGSNLGDRVRHLEVAVRGLSRVVRVEALSSLYRTEAVGDERQPEFLNLVLVGSTLLTPRALLAAMQRLERRLGRERPYPGAARTLDLDLLDHGGRVITSPELVLPHPRLHQRGFVLHPLAEVAPEWLHPVLGRTAPELAAAAKATGRVARAGRIHPSYRPLAGGEAQG
jgi:2-amino-4-hydroxy-6-hydroxymethyldihydropteridine diphosphokinase